jgi:unsaturated chondroitin disaccharide hydrolase
MKFKIMCCFAIISIWVLNSFAIDNKMDSIVNKAISVSLSKLDGSVTEIKDSTKYPSYATYNLKWSTTGVNGASGWTSGFYPGCLWYAYALSKDVKFNNYAKRWTSYIEKEKTDSTTHDLGFIIHCSFGNGLRFDSANLAGKYKPIILQSAQSLNKRYVSNIGVIKCYWDINPYGSDKTSVPVVVDIMMNLEMLMWAAANGGSSVLMDNALSHARKTYADLVRPDSSTYHVVRYRSTTGLVYNKGQLQGEDSLSTWTRGHAWVTYGMVTCYRFSKNKEFLNYACALADYFLKRLSSDMVAIWDFDSKPVNAHIKDASASAIVCAALFELSQYLEPSRGMYYYNKAKAILAALCDPKYLSVNENTNALLLHSTQYLYDSYSKINTDKPAIFADYYFLESLYRYKTMPAPVITNVKNRGNYNVALSRGNQNSSYKTFSLDGKLIKGYKQTTLKTNTNYLNVEVQTGVKPGVYIIRED